MTWTIVIKSLIIIECLLILYAVWLKWVGNAYDEWRDKRFMMKYRGMTEQEWNKFNNEQKETQQ